MKVKEIYIVGLYMGIFSRFFGKKSDRIAQELLTLISDISRLSPTLIYIKDKETDAGGLGDAVPAICGAINLAIERLRQDKPRTAYSLLKALEQEIHIGIIQTEALAMIGAVPVDSQRINILKGHIKKLEKISNKIKRELLYELT